MYAIAVIAAVMICKRRYKGAPALVDEVALWGFPAGLIGGRLYFLVTSWDEAPHTWWGPFAVWKGGLGVWGGIAAGNPPRPLGLHPRRARTSPLLGAGAPRPPAAAAGGPHGDYFYAAAPGLLVAQAIGRIGNYFNQELFGGPTRLPWGLHIDLAHRPAAYAAYSTFHPTFLYELVWNLSLAGFLVLLGRTGRVRAPGLFALYVAGYSGFRIFEETLRVDSAHHILGLRLNFFVASLLCAGGLAWFARMQRTSWRARGATLLAAGWLIASLAGCAQSFHH